MDDRSKQKEVPSASRAIPLVGIGASAGGLEPLQRFFERCPEDTGLAFVVIQHLPPKGESALAEILAKSASIEVEHIVDGMEIEPDRLYVLSPDFSLTLSQGIFRTEQLKTDHPGLIVDRFFESMARDCGDRVVGVVLSGTGTDGAEGVKAIREAGGMVMVQNPDEAQFDGMPAAAIHTGVADAILDVQAMPEELINYVRHAPQFQFPEGYEAERGASETLNKIVELLFQKRPNDFTRYK